VCVRESACLCVRVCELVCVCAHMCVYERENLSREREREGARENEPLSHSLSHSHLRFIEVVAHFLGHSSMSLGGRKETHTHRRTSSVSGAHFQSIMQRHIITLNTHRKNRTLP